MPSEFRIFPISAKHWALSNMDVPDDVRLIISQGFWPVCGLWRPPQPLTVSVAPRGVKGYCLVCPDQNQKQRQTRIQHRVQEVYLQTLQQDLSQKSWLEEIKDVSFLLVAASVEDPGLWAAPFWETLGAVQAFSCLDLCQVISPSSCGEAKGVALYLMESTFSYCSCRFAC